MKKFLKIAAIVVVILAAGLYGFRRYTKTHSPEATVDFVAGDLAIRVKYCQPAKKGREIFGPGKLVPYKQVWRTGANEATQISFSRDIKWGETIVKAGTYTLFTTPDEGQWSAMLNRVTEQWGAYSYDAAKNAATTTARVESQPESTEQLTLSLVPAGNGADLLIVWDKTRVTVPIRR